MSPPLPGQRWMSTSEPELGLGLVTEADVSRVRIRFPGAGETRVYAIDGAPLKRVAFQAGDEVEHADGRVLHVEAVREERGQRVYLGGGQAWPESELSDRADMQGPADRLLLGTFDEAEDYALRLAAWTRARALAQDPARGLRGGRIGWIPHQMAIARELAHRAHPRVLLADEVGLGKTIEACLVLHHGLVCGWVGRALILVPPALTHPWFVELLRRFQISCAIYDEERCATALDENPFLRDPIVLCPIDLLAGNEERARQAQAGEWDLLIVDEAHHLAWDETGGSPAYRVVEGLAAKVPSLLLLTATPEQQGLASHFAHLRLLDPERYPDLAGFLAEQSDYQRHAEAAERLRAAGKKDELRRLLEAHGPGRVMFRNTREDVPGFPERRLLPARLPDIATARLDWLESFLRAEPKRKVLLLTGGTAEVKALDERLRARLGFPIALFHEDQALIERDRQAAWFAEADGANLLIASDLGGEGRNFQFAKDLVLFDLPADPDLIEQRIGRLDRIGQDGPVRIHVPVVEGSCEAGLLRWFDEGLGLFQKPLAGAHRCLERFRDRLDKVDDALIAETRVHAAEIEATIRGGRNRLIQLKHQAEAATRDPLLGLAAGDADPDLVPFVRRLWASFGLELEALNPSDLILRHGPYWSGLLPVPEHGLRMTRHRERALAREDLQLLTWDHPLLRHGIEALLASTKGTCACVRAASSKELLVESVWILEALAPAALRLGRFLPATPLLCRVNARGESVDARFGDVEPAEAEALVFHPQFRNTLLPEALEAMEDLAGQAAEAPLRQAKRRATELLAAEIKRLEDLRAVNDHVRQDEIDHLRIEKKEILAAIARARPRLDAIRLILPGG